MGNRVAVAEAEYEEPAVPAGEPPLRQQGFPPRLRAHRLKVAFCAAFWGVAGLLSTMVPGADDVNLDHVMLYFVLLISGILLLLSLAAPDVPAAERVAGHVEGVLNAVL